VTTVDGMTHLRALAEAARIHDKEAMYEYREAVEDPDVVLALLDERDALRAGLRRFGVHAELCQWMISGRPCDCGLRALRDPKP